MSSHIVTLQIAAPGIAGDWVTRPAGDSRTLAGGRTGVGRRVPATRSDVLAITIGELRGAVEALRRGGCSIDISQTRTQHLAISYGEPAGYQGMGFVVG